MITTMSDYAKTQTGQKPLAVYFLWFSLIFLSILGMVNGADFIINPNEIGGAEKVELLKNLPFVNFLIPGIMLFTLIGICPWFILYGLMNRWEWRFARKINLYKDQYWAWTNTIYFGIGMILLNDLLFMFVGCKYFLQDIFALYGLAIVVIALLPSVKNYYSAK